MAVTINGNGVITFHDGTTQTTAPVASSFAGDIKYFAASTPPTGWIKANGAAVNRVTYSALFAVIGTTYGAGDGSTTFNVPDLRGEFVRGWDDARGVDSGRAIGTAQAQTIESHSHSMSYMYGGTSNNGPSSQGYGSGGLGSGPYSTNATGSTETRPRNVAMLACIKY